MLYFQKMATVGVDVNPEAEMALFYGFCQDNNN